MLFQLFKTFLWISTLTVGGGAAMIPVINKEIVEKRKYMTQEEFLDALGIAQSVPGVLGCNISIIVGYKIKGLAGEPVEEKNDIYKLAVALSMFGNADDYASILWNLINLGYADIKYTYEEREIVDFLRNHWKITEDLYQEMIDVAETCLALEEHKKWVESLEDSSYKDEKMKQIKKDIKSAQDGIKITLAELKF